MPCREHSGPVDLLSCKTQHVGTKVLTNFQGGKHGNKHLNRDINIGSTSYCYYEDIGKIIGYPCNFKKSFNL